MKRVSDALAVPGNGGAVTTPNVAPGGNTRCAAYGCPLAGGITDSTKGGGVWYCRFHFQAGSGAFDEITKGLREKIRNGEPLDSTEPTATVKWMRERLKKRS